MRRSRIAVPQVIVPISRVDRATLRALAYARSISIDVTVLVLAPPAAADGIRHRVRMRMVDAAIATRGPDGLAPYLDERERQDPERPITVVLSDVVPKHPWSYPLHDEALRLKLRLFVRPNTVVVDVPFHI